MIAWLNVEQGKLATDSDFTASGGFFMQSIMMQVYSWVRLEPVRQRVHCT